MTDDNQPPKRRWSNLIFGWPKALLRQWPLLVVIIVFIVGIVLVLEMHWRRGAMMMGGAVGLAGFWRLVLTDEQAGLLVVRHKAWDVIVPGLVGVAMIILAILVPSATAGR